jgi:iron-sulfur cluster repair protein YtfE (RIC family)
MSILDQNIGQLARDIPGITAVFHKYQLDLINHIHLENNILFNRIDGQLEDVRNG